MNTQQCQMMKGKNINVGRFVIITAMYFCLINFVLATNNEQILSSNECKVDFRYAPKWWQTLICLPDDWQKTLVGKDGSLLYDYPGKFSGFSLKISSGIAETNDWIEQKPFSPKIPIIKTIYKKGGLTIEQTAFAVAPVLKEERKTSIINIERIDSQTVQMDWAKPAPEYAPAFRNIAVGWNQPIKYRFKPERANQSYVVVFGLCEGWHTNAFQRTLDLKIEGRTRKTIDMVAEYGQNVPAVFSISAKDENGDGWIDVSVEANGKDKNAILNALWIFREGETPSSEELLRGQTTKQPLIYVACGEDIAAGKLTRRDIVITTYRNSGNAIEEFTPQLTIECENKIAVDLKDKRLFYLRPGTILFLTREYDHISNLSNKTIVIFPKTTLKPGSEISLVYCAARGKPESRISKDLSRADKLLNQSVSFWQKLDLPYNHIHVPDEAVQGLIDSSIRNIYQAREIKDGLPAFQVGATCYRGLWVVDGSFIIEAVTFLSRTNEARNGIKYLMNFQRDDGGIMLIDGHWKETGIALWAITRHAALTGDKTWLEANWNKVEKAVGYIIKMRNLPPKDAPNARLIPDGFSDGGLADKVPEYTNIYWTLAGWRAAIEAAKWLGKFNQAQQWQNEYDDFYNTFKKAVERDLKTDKYGNTYLPIRMKSGENIPPQKAQWAFLHSVFPGKVFSANDPLVKGNMAMLRAVESQGLVSDTGWLKNGIWTYFGSFYGHAWLWLGDGQKAAKTLLAFANHASPLMVWREEQMPILTTDATVGDMPHNWASAEFIRLTRNCITLERGNELHLFEGVPSCWIKPGAAIKLNNIITEFGAISLDLKVSSNGKYAELIIKPPLRNPPARIIVHQPWSAKEEIIELYSEKSIVKRIKIAE